LYVTYWYGNLKGKIPLGRPGNRCDDNVEMNLPETECDGTVWIHLVQGREPWWALLNTVINF
jgi:hypothetical protein